MIRRLIKAGPISLATSLPVEWIKKNKLKAGSEIKIQENQNMLTISSQTEVVDSSIKIKYDELLIDNMFEKLFWENYNKIIIYDDKKLPIILKEKIKILPGFEIIDESEKTMVIERILEPSLKNSKNIINRCYHLIKNSLEKNPPKFDTDLHELLLIARMYKQDSREIDILLLFIECINRIDVRMHDDAYMRLRNTYAAIHEQKFRFNQQRTKELSGIFDETDVLFNDYFKNSKQSTILAKAYHAFSLLKELNREIIRKQSIEELTKIEDRKKIKPYTIGICLKNQSNDFWGKEVLQGMKNIYAKYSDIDLVIKYPLTDFNVEQQRKILEKFIDDKVDIIVYAPIDPKALENTLRQINKENIPLIVLDTDLELSRIKYKHIGFNNYKGGKITAEYLLTKIKNKREIIVLEGHLKGNFSQRTDGFIDKIGKENAKVMVGEFTGSTAYEAIKEYAKNHKINAVFATSDNMALGVAQALKELHISVPICGFDATKEGQAALKEGILSSTLNTHPEKLGELAIQIAHDKIDNKTIPDRIEYDIELMTK